MKIYSIYAGTFNSMMDGYKRWLDEEFRDVVSTAMCGGDGGYRILITYRDYDYEED